MPNQMLEKMPHGVLGKMRRLFARMMKRPMLFTGALSVILVLVIEMLSRHSVIGCFSFVFSHPLRFLVNVFFVLTTLSLSFLFPRRDFTLVLISVLWLTLGVVNCVLLGYRTTPLGLIDFALLKSSVGIINVYFDLWQLILLGLLICAIISALVFLFIKLPRRKINIKPAALFLAFSLAGSLVSYVAVSDKETVAASFANIAGAYSDFGFVYCFSTSAVDRGIDQPDGYSESSINKILRSLTDDGQDPAVKPNVVMVQLESFFDVKYLDDTEFEEDPIPNFTYLEKNCSSGFLTVPSVGAGTANTEFEVLSGMSLDFFGMGEYPYKTILQEEACGSVCTILKELGYTCHAIHNNTGTFYDRNVVFSQLGFDTFTSIEYMQDVEYNPIGWAKDKCLVEEIVKALDTSDGSEFVFTISVQGHGKYQRGAGEEDVEGIDTTVFDDEDVEAAFEYYVSQISEMDEFIGELVSTLEQRGEPTVLVLYGDHLPNFDIGAEQLRNGDIFETEYVIWNNMGLEDEHENLPAYRLSSKVLGMIGVDNGILTKLHQQCPEDEDYLKSLELLEYDMLYGSCFCYGGHNPHTPTELKMGTEPITISGVKWEDGVLYVYGDGFTQWSEILVGGSDVETTLVDNGTLTAETDMPDTGTEIAVRQQSRDFTVLSVSDGVGYGINIQK